MMLELKLTNTFSGQREVFQPLNPQRVTLYVCGPTVYNFAHIGNARPVVVFDTLYRVLKGLYPNVVYARNITDIDDKIMTAARDRGVSIESISQEFTQAFREDVSALNTLAPTLEPHATENIEAMLDLTQRLIDSNHAYVADGHVLFAVESMDGYGQLSGRKLEDMLAGARVEVADYKQHPGDFVLWKPSADDEPGWQSPWGRGRPGWHLECSAMIKAHLGDAIDIHGGGRDLIFPHHENERAQSCCAYGGEFVRYWLHNAYVDMDGEKMSKSLGNVKTIRDLLARYDGEVLRLALLSAHYRSALNFSGALLDNAKSTLDGFYMALRNAADVVPVTISTTDTSVFKALLDDLNTPEAIAALHASSKSLNKATGEARAKAKGELLAGARVLGLLGCDPEQWFTGRADSHALSAEKIAALIEERIAAKRERDYARADAIRAQLNDAGVVLEDSASGTTWRRI